MDFHLRYLFPFQKLQHLLIYLKSITNQSSFHLVLPPLQWAKECRQTPLHTACWTNASKPAIIAQHQRLAPTGTQSQSVSANYSKHAVRRCRIGIRCYRAAPWPCPTCSSSSLYRAASSHGATDVVGSLKALIGAAMSIIRNYI